VQRVTANPAQRDADAPEALFRSHQRRLWALGYRLTGSAEDADDVVQETFARLLERPPQGEVSALAPWLVRVATNLGIDALRRRRRRAYPGAWLPSPAELADTDACDAYPSGEGRDPETRYGLLESASYAFLLALEALGPRQRAVLLLRDVLGYSAREAARTLGTTEGNVRVLHARARRALAGYDRERCRPDQALRERHRDALERFLAALAAQDGAALAGMLAEDVQTRTDAGGEYAALGAPLAGRERVAKLYLRAALHRRDAGPTTSIRLVNGLPAAVIELARPKLRLAPRSVIRLELDAEGRIREIHAVLAPRKLGAVHFRGGGEAPGAP
jgi:RNA polymerase sigma-70 factor (ECF subfamily)